MKKGLLVLKYFVIIVISIIIFITIIEVYSKNHVNDSIYRQLTAESERVRQSVENYYITENEKKDIYKEIDNIDELIKNKDFQITSIFENISKMKIKLNSLEKENVRKLYN